MASRQTSIDEFAVVVREGRMAQATLVELPGGTAAVFSTPRPGGDRPNQDVAAVLPVGERAVIGQRGRAKLRSLPHGPTGYAIQAGLRDEDEAMHHDERHLVSNIVGDPGRRIEVGSALTLAPRDTALVASDGLADNLSPDEIAEHIRRGSLVEVAHRLAVTCRRRMLGPHMERPFCPDDATFILFRQNSPALRSRANAAR